MPNPSRPKSWLKITGFWNLRNGDLRSAKITKEIYDALQKVEVGGRFIFEFVPEDRKDSDSIPDAGLKYITPEEVEEFTEAVTAKRNGKNLNNSKESL